MKEQLDPCLDAFLIIDPAIAAFGAVTLYDTRWEQRTKLKTELLNRVEHFRDSHNDFNEFISHSLRTKTKYSACALDSDADTHDMITINTTLHAVPAY